MNAWVRKEIRDAARWAPIGIFCLGALLWYSLYKAKANPAAYSQLSGSMYALVWFVSAAFASFLGLANYLPETIGSARGFLVQRGISLQRIFFIRSVVNFAIYLVAMFVPIGLVACYLSVIGPFDAPVAPAQVVPSMVAVLYCFSFYFGAVAVACGTSRWFGSRLFPLFAATAAAASAAPIVSLSNPVMVFVTVMPLGLVGMILLLLTSRHMFLRGPSRPAPSRSRTSSFYEKATLVLAVVAATVVVGAFVSSSFSASYSYSGVRYSKEGVPWLVETSTRNVNGYSRQSEEVQFELSEAIEKPTSKPELKELFHGIGFSYPWFYSNNHWDMVNLGWFESRGGVPLNVVGYRGLLYVYSNRLVAVVGKDSVAALRNAQTPFSEIPRLLANGPFLSAQMAGQAPRSLASVSGSFAIVATDGIYQIDLDSDKVERILESNIREHAFVGATNEHPNQIIISDGDSISLYSATGQAINGKLSQPERIATLGVPKDMANHFEDGNTTLFFGNSGKWGANNWTLVRAPAVPRGKNVYEIARSNQSEITHFKTKIPDATIPAKANAIRRDTVMPALLIPPICLAFFAVVSQWSGIMNPELYHCAWFVVAQAVLSGILATLAARRRGLAVNQCAAWCLAGVLIGVGAWIVVLSAYSRVVFAKCPSCNRNRRLDNDRCESCGAIWEPPTPIGIELFERDEPCPELLVSSAM